MRLKEINIGVRIENFQVLDMYKTFVSGKSRTIVKIQCNKCGRVREVRLEHLKYDRECNHKIEGKNMYERIEPKRSYGERIVKEVLKQQEIPFRMERSFKWSDNRRYDFVLDRDNTIIEVHGIQHYENQDKGQRFHNSLEEQRKIDKDKEERAKSMGFYYIVLDARDLRMECFKGIIESIGVPTNKVDWEKVYLDSYCMTKYTEQLIELYNKGLTLNELSEYTKLDKGTITSKIKELSKLGLVEGHDEFEFSYRYFKKSIKDIENKRSNRVNGV